MEGERRGMERLNETHLGQKLVARNRMSSKGRSSIFTTFICAKPKCIIIITKKSVKKFSGNVGYPVSVIIAYDLAGLKTLTFVTNKTMFYLLN